MNNQPSHEAILLAVKLSGHSMCRTYLTVPGSDWPCDGCLGDAATIDRELRLPERNAALLAAQGVIDAYDREGDVYEGRWSELRDTLANIK